MQCKYLTIRTKNYKKYKFCRLNRQVILNECENCSNLILKANKPIFKRTSKQKQLEEKRYSILTKNLDKCYICKKVKDDIHEIYGGSNRKRSIENGFCVPLCRQCHQNELIIQKLRIIMQKEYEKNHTREEFIKLISKSYIKENE